MRRALSRARQAAFKQVLCNIARFLVGIRVWRSICVFDVSHSCRAVSGHPIQHGLPHCDHCILARSQCFSMQYAAQCHKIRLPQGIDALFCLARGACQPLGTNCLHGSGQLRRRRAHRRKRPGVAYPRFARHGRLLMLLICSTTSRRPSQDKFPAQRVAAARQIPPRCSCPDRSTGRCRWTWRARRALPIRSTSSSNSWSAAAAARSFRRSSHRWS